MERVKYFEQQFSQSPKHGLPLKELVNFEVKERTKQSTPPVSEIVLFLAEAMETYEFWIELNKHLSSDVHKRTSIGGAFSREHGKEKFKGYTWESLFDALNNFLSFFEISAAEFIFAYFYPSHANEKVISIVLATRKLAIDQYVRLRRAYWDDYIEVFNTYSFWVRLEKDLFCLDEPVSYSKFFPPATKPEWESPILRDVSPIDIDFAIGFKVVIPSNKKILHIKYSDVSQIIRDQLGQDARTFLLSFSPTNVDNEVVRLISRVKKMLEERVLPIKEKPEKFQNITKEELDETIASLEFWDELMIDIEQSLNSEKQVFSFSRFLRNYDKSRKEIVEGKTGSYAYLATPFITETIAKRRELLYKPSEQLAHYLLWSYVPDENIESIVNEIKSLCAEVFPLDCLFVRLQTLDFWEKLRGDLYKLKRRVSFLTFLRYFSEKNSSCDPNLNEKDIGSYKDLRHRAYHNQEDLILLLKKLGINVSDYKSALVELFKKTAPSPDFINILEEQFPKDFSSNGVKEVLESKKKYNLALKTVKEVITSRKAVEISCDSKEDAIALKKKVQAAARSLKEQVSIRVRNTILVITLSLVRTQEEREEVEEKVKILREDNIKNVDIANALGIDIHDVEYAVTSLLKKGLVSSRKRISD